MSKILFIHKVFPLELKNPVWQGKKTTKNPPQNDSQIKLLPSINPRFSMKKLQSLLTFTIQSVKYCLAQLRVAKIDLKIC